MKEKLKREDFTQDFGMAVVNNDGNLEFVESNYAKGKDEYEKVKKNENRPACAERSPKGSEKMKKE